MENNKAVITLNMENWVSCEFNKVITGEEFASALGRACIIFTGGSLRQARNLADAVADFVNTEFNRDKFNRRFDDFDESMQNYPDYKNLSTRARLLFFAICNYRLWLFWRDEDYFPVTPISAGEYSVYELKFVYRNITDAQELERLFEDDLKELSELISIDLIEKYDEKNPKYYLHIDTDLYEIARRRGLIYAAERL